MSIKSFITKHVLTAATARPTGQEAVAVFYYGKAPDAESIPTLAPGARATISKDGSKTRVSLEWADVSAVITLDSAWDKTAQMAGMHGWTERFPQRVRESAQVQALVGSFDQVTACHGIVCKPGLDAEGKVGALLKSLIVAEGGFFFSRNSFYGADGVQITGYDEDPPALFR